MPVGRSVERLKLLKSVALKSREESEGSEIDGRSDVTSERMGLSSEVTS